MAVRRASSSPKRTFSRIWTAAGPGQSRIVSPRKESDTVQILSGTFGGKTLGTPICLWVKNEDARPEAYAEMKTKFRPSHADFTYFAKYGIRNWQGGGRASARETVGRVAAGAIAKKILRERFGVETLAYVKQVQRLVADVNPDKVKFKDVESNIVRCPDPKAAEKMIRLIEKMRTRGRHRRRHRRRHCARRARRLGRTGVRQAGSGSGQGDVESAGVQGI